MNTDQVILIDKPFRWTSFDAVKKVRNVLSKNISGTAPKVGHAGTLDPLATGLLVICTGSFTKKITAIQNAEKEYTGSITIGNTTASFDLETEPRDTKNYSHITEGLIRETADQFKGKNMQTPPAHSAIKINGRRAYDMARKGVEMKIAPKEVEIKEFEITGIDLPRIDIRVVCSKGTYIRSLADDFGKKLGCGAFLSALCRTRIGEYRLENALSMDDFIRKYAPAAEVSAPEAVS